jgi:hypothetical protein
MTGSSQPALRRTSTVVSESLRNSANFDAASWCLELALTPRAFEKTALAFCVLPGSTAMSHPNGTSAKAPKSQMPVCSIASLPLLNRLVSKSAVPCPCSIVGIVVPLFSVSHLAASMPAGVSKATFVPALFRNDAPFCTSAL